MRLLVVAPSSAGMAIMEDGEADDLFRLFCGTKIGEGQYRIVYAHALDSTLVIKRERAFNNFSNVMEWDFWTCSKGSKVRRWLAPVEWLSPGGMWLIQKRTYPLGARAIPKRVPDVFCDLKDDNWGLLDGRVVCHDYGNNRAVQQAFKRARLVSSK